MTSNDFDESVTTDNTEGTSRLAKARAWAQEHPRATMASALVAALLMGTGIGGSGSAGRIEEAEAAVSASESREEQLAEEIEILESELDEIQPLAALSEGHATSLSTCEADLETLTADMETLTADIEAREADVAAAEAAIADREVAVAAREEAVLAAEAGPSVSTSDQIVGFADTAPAAPAEPVSAYYGNCSEARAAGAAPLYRGDPGYRSGLDRDDDGVACE